MASECFNPQTKGPTLREKRAKGCATPARFEVITEG
jgi:hypothetical protein